MKVKTPYAATAKTPTGIVGFDEITDGGLPRGRTTLVLGGPGCGKTVLALQTLVNGAQRKEAGIFVAFEESTVQIVANAATFGWDLPALAKKKLFFLDARLAGDAAGLARAAHALKGSVGNFGITESFESAQTLERMGREGMLVGAVERFDALEDQLGRLEDDFADFVADEPMPASVGGSRESP